MKNKGFSLIELIVALAVGSIVLLMVSIMLVRGTSLFRKENSEVNMRNDYQIIRNQVDQILMEAKMLIVEEQGDLLIIYTGEVDADRVFTATNKTTERIITYDKEHQNLYISGTYDSHMAPGNLIAANVAKFEISLDESSLRTQTNASGNEERYYVNPLKINVSLAINNEKHNFDDDDGDEDYDLGYEYTVSLRNRLRAKDADDKKILFYETTSSMEVLDGSALVESYLVK